MKNTSHVVVIVSNGPGELSTWVKPLADKLHNQILMRPFAEKSSLGLRLVLVPCPNATGKEKDAASHWGQFETITPANVFWDLLLKPKKYAHWPRKGLVIFLGGDQFWSVLLSARLGYKHLTYAEWTARWPQWNDRIAAMSPTVRERLPRRFRNRCTVVGDLMADLPKLAKSQTPLPEGQWIAIMPGSKKAKLSIGVPFLLEVADRLAKKIPNCKFLLPIAPTTSIKDLENFLGKQNPLASKYHSGIAKILSPEKTLPWPKLLTTAGTEIYLHENHPAHGALSQCTLALTTVGANTAELGALNVPMIVIVPTQHLSVMQAWDGLIGVIARLPFFRWGIGLLLSLWRLSKHGYLAWPNISAGRMVVPEKVGKIFPEEIAEEAAEWLLSPERLQGQKSDLQSLRGNSGAVQALTKEILNLLPDKLKS